MNLFALKLLHLRVHINTNDSNFLLYRGPDSSPKGPHPYGEVLFSRKDTWMNLFALKLLHLRVHINTNDSNFLLYRGPDSSPKGPFAPKLIYSAEQIHEWTFLHWTITPWSSQKHLTDLFCRTDTWMNLFALKLLYVGVYKITNDSNFLLCRGPDSSPKGHMPPNRFIQPNRYMNESVCIETITWWSLQKHQWQQLSPVQGPRQ